MMDRPYLERPKNGQTATVQELYDILKSEVEAGRGDVHVLYDTEGRKANCHLVSVYGAGFQGQLDSKPGARDPYCDIFCLYPDLSRGEFS